MNKLTDQLQMVDQLLSDESKWCQFTTAMDELDWEVHPTDPKACRWCLIGAMIKVVGSEDEILDAVTFLDVVCLANFDFSCCTRLNDFGTFEDVKHLLKLGIEKCSMN